MVVAGVLSVQADRGAIPFQPEVTIFEPTQRALIAWNGEEEILILSTDLRASRATKVLEVMPFPAEPRVKKGDVGVFRRAVKLINSKILRPVAAAGRRYGLEPCVQRIPRRRARSLFTSESAPTMWRWRES